MNVMLTGSRGYLGSHVFSALRKAGHNIVGMSGRNDADWGDMAMDDKIDTVIHLGWYSSAGDAHPMIHQLCMEQTHRLVQSVVSAEKRNPVRKPTPWFVFASTASVYGSSDEKVFTEHDKPVGSCAYTRRKCEAERYIVAQLPWRHTILRFGSLMGKGILRTKTDVVVNALASEAYTMGKCRVWRPDDWKPVLHVRDAAMVVRLVAEKNWRGVFNAASGCYRARDIAKMVELQTGCEVETVEGDSPRRSCRVDCSRLVERMGGHRTREVPEAIHEFEGFVPSSQDKNTPWF